MIQQHLSVFLAAIILSGTGASAQVIAPAPRHAGFSEQGLAGTIAGVPSYGWPDEIGFRGLLMDRAAFGLVGPVKHVLVERADLPRGGKFTENAPPSPPPPPQLPEGPRRPMYEAWFDAEGRVKKLRTWDMKVNNGIPGWELRYVWEGEGRGRLTRIDGGDFDFKEPSLRVLTRHDDRGRLVELTNERLVQGAWFRDAREELVFEGDRPIKLVVERPDGISTETIIRRGEGGYRLQRFADARLNFAASREVDAQGRIVRSKVANQPATVFTYDGRGRLATMTPEGGDAPRWRRLPDDPADANRSVIESRLDNIGTTFIYTESSVKDAAGNDARIDVRVAWRGKAPPGGFAWPVTDHRVYWTVEYHERADLAAQPAAGSGLFDPYFVRATADASPTMPRTIIRTIRQDREGHIWFATFGGPIRFDGKAFTNLDKEVGLAGVRLFSVLPARSGAVWFGSVGTGASRYDGKTFTRFTRADGLAGDEVWCIFEDRDANIWFGTGGGVSRWDGKAMTSFTTRDGLAHDSVYSIVQDASGRVWFGTQGGVCSFDGKAFTPLTDAGGKRMTNTRALVIDRAGNLWCGGERGAFRFDGKAVTTFTAKDGLLDDFVGSMIVDRSGAVWLGHPGQGGGGSRSGATRFDGKAFAPITRTEGLCGDTVYAMLEDKDGNIWFGTLDAGGAADGRAGACRYDGKTFTDFSTPTARSPSTPPSR